MNISKGVLLLLAFVIFSINMTANTENPKSKDPAVSGDKKTSISTEDFDARWEANSFSMEVVYNADVKKHVKRYIAKDRRGTEMILGRQSIYFPIFEKYIKELGLPKELKNLPIIESALDPMALSPVGARGLWQFMPATARMYGLVIDDYVDERCDPVKSTIAGLTYLRDLYVRYEDWKLALAAYNCGPGRVNKAMRQSGKDTFAGIKKFLPKETQQYVAKFIAASYVTENYFFHDLRPVYPEYTLQFCKTVKIHKRISLSEVSKLTRIKLDTIKKLNPSYRKGIIPPSAEGSYLIIPIFGEELSLIE